MAAAFGRGHYPLADKGELETFSKRLGGLVRGSEQTAGISNER